MIRTLRKEASALCCEAVQGASWRWSRTISIICIIYRIYIKHIKCIIIYFVLYSTNRGRWSWIWIWRMENMQPSNWTVWATESRSLVSRWTRGEASPDCSGIQCNIWERAKKRSLLTHRLASGGHHNLGYAAVPWESILHGKWGDYGACKILSVLPDKLGQYFFEY